MTRTPLRGGVRRAGRAYEFRRGTFMAASNWVLALPGHRVRQWYLAKVLGNSIGRDLSLERGCRVTCRGGIVIGDNVVINRGTVLDGRGGLSIGDRTNISEGVRLITAAHDPNSPDFAEYNQPITVGSSVWLATNSMLLPGSVVEDGAVVAAGALVHGVIPGWTIVGGVPARHIKDRERSAQSSLGTYRRWFH